MNATAARNWRANGWRWRSRSRARAPDESLRYARFLIRDGRIRMRPNRGAGRCPPQPTRAMLAMLAELAELYMPPATGPARRNGRRRCAIGTPEADTEPRRRCRPPCFWGRTAPMTGIAFLEGHGRRAAMSDTATVAMILQTQLRTGKPHEARSYLDDQMLAETPTIRSCDCWRGSLYAVTGDADSRRDDLPRPDRRRPHGRTAGAHALRPAGRSGPRPRRRRPCWMRR